MGRIADMVDGDTDVLEAAHVLGVAAVAAVLDAVTDKKNLRESAGETLTPDTQVSRTYLHEPADD